MTEGEKMFQYGFTLFLDSFGFGFGAVEPPGNSAI